MVQKNVIAHSKASLSKASAKRQIEDFTGNHSASDITPAPLNLDVSQTKKIEEMTEANPTIVEDSSVLGQIKKTTLPPTRIPDVIEVETQRKINNFIAGKNG